MAYGGAEPIEEFFDYLTLTPGAMSETDFKMAGIDDDDIYIGPWAEIVRACKNDFDLLTQDGRLWPELISVARTLMEAGNTRDCN